MKIHDIINRSSETCDDQVKQAMENVRFFKLHGDKLTATVRATYLRQRAMGMCPPAAFANALAVGDRALYRCDPTTLFSD